MAQTGGAVFKRRVVLGRDGLFQGPTTAVRAETGVNFLMGYPNIAVRVGLPCFFVKGVVPHFVAPNDGEIVNAKGATGYLLDNFVGQRGTGGFSFFVVQGGLGRGDGVPGPVKIVRHDANVFFLQP